MDNELSFRVEGFSILALSVLGNFSILRFQLPFALSAAGTFEKVDKCLFVSLGGDSGLRLWASRV